MGNFAKDFEKVKASVLTMFYGPHEGKECISADEFFDEEDKVPLTAIEYNIINRENQFNFVKYVWNKSSEEIEKIVVDYENHLRFRKEDSNHQSKDTYKLMELLYFKNGFLFLNNKLTPENSISIWEGLAYANEFCESYLQTNSLENVLYLYEHKADLYKMLGTIEKRIDLLEMGLEEIKKYQDITQLNPEVRNKKGELFQYIASLTNEGKEIQENINKSLYQFEKALQQEFNLDYINNYIKSKNMELYLGLKTKEKMIEGTKRFIDDIKSMYPDVDINVSFEEGNEEV